MTWLRNRRAGTEIVFDNDVIVVLDVEESFSPERTVTLTKHPVENGFDITDHARNEPARISVKGYISDSHSGEPTNRDITIIAALIDNMERFVTCSIFSDGILYFNMIITRLATPRTRETGEGSEVDIDFEELRIANSLIVFNDDLENPRRNGSGVNVGEIASARDTLTGQAEKGLTNTEASNEQAGNPSYVDVQVKTEEKDASTLWEISN